MNGVIAINISNTPAFSIWNIEKPLKFNNILQLELEEQNDK